MPQLPKNGGLMDINDLLNASKPTPSAPAAGRKKATFDEEGVPFTAILAQTDQPDPADISLTEGGEFPLALPQNTPANLPRYSAEGMAVEEIALPKLPAQFNTAAGPDGTAASTNAAALGTDKNALLASLNGDAAATTLSSDVANTVIPATVNGAAGAKSSENAPVLGSVTHDAQHTASTQLVSDTTTQDLIPDAQKQGQAANKSAENAPAVATSITAAQMPLSALVDSAKSAPASRDSAAKNTPTDGLPVLAGGTTKHPTTDPISSPNIRQASDLQDQLGLPAPRNLREQHQAPVPSNKSADVPDIKPASPPVVATAVPTQEVSAQVSAAAALPALSDLPELPMQLPQHSPVVTDASALSVQATTALKSSTFANGVAHQLVANLARGTDGAIEIRLDPPELGRIAMKLVVTEAGAMVNVSAERADVLDLMRRHENALLKELNDAGFGDVNLNFGQDQTNDQDKDPDEATSQQDYIVTQNTAVQRIASLTASTTDSQLDIRL